MKLLWSGTWSRGTLTLADLPKYSVIAVGTSNGAGDTTFDSVSFCVRGYNGSFSGVTGVSTGTEIRQSYVQLSSSGNRLTYVSVAYWSSATGTRYGRKVYRVYGVV